MVASTQDDDDAGDGCVHGGAAFAAIGPRFDALDRRQDVIAADVLDAWFETSPRALAAIRDHLPWLLRTSPPTACEGLLDVIAEVRGVPRHCLLPGAGSSELIHLALRRWLAPGARVLLLDPTYGEYLHVARQVGCTVERLPLAPQDDFDVDAGALAAALARAPDLVVVVNPNSPTGRHVRREALLEVLALAPARTRLWIDETYVEYAGEDQSLERWAAASANAIVCKSMSKVYALSGLRCAYLCGAAELVAAVRRVTPPWAIGTIGQLAAAYALQDVEHYTRCWARTHELRADLAGALARRCGVRVVPSTTNFLLCLLPSIGPVAAEVAARCREHGLFLRDVGDLGTTLGDRALRVAVQDAPVNERIVAILARALRPSG